MRYREFAPDPALRDVVHRFWMLEGDAPATLGEFQRAMPDGRPELIFNLADRFERRVGGAVERQPRALLVGPTTRALLLRPAGRVSLVGARLAPGAWPALLDVAGEDLLDQALALPEVSRPWREDLLEPLAERRDPAARIGLLQRRLVAALRSKGRRGRWDDRRLRAAVQLTLGGGLRVSRVAELAGVSPRHLGRLFREGAGMGPRLLGRLGRFQRVLRELEGPGPVRWAALAHRHGYYDQAHLCRDFRRFAGQAPGAYLAAAREVTRHFVDGGEPA